MLDDVCCSSQLVLSLHLRFVSCNGFKFGNLGISLSGDIERVERVFLSMSSYAGGVSVLQWCRKYLCCEQEEGYGVCSVRSE